MNTSISGGAFFSLGNVPTAIARIAGGPSRRVHGVVLALGLVGAVALARRERAAVALLLGAALSMALVVLAYDRFDERMRLAATVVLLPLGGAAFDWSAVAERHGPILVSAAVGGFALLWLDPLRGLSQPAETQLLETRVAARASAVPLPADGLIIAEQPSVLGAGGRLAMATTEALAREARLVEMVAAGQPVYFLCDMFCEPGFAGGNGSASCDAMFARFALAPVVEEIRPGRTYGLYRLAPPDAGAAMPPSCPRPRRPTVPP